MKALAIADIVVRGRYRKELGDIKSLASSIETIGLLHPIAVTSDNMLIAGWRRIEAFKLLGRKSIPVNVVDLDRVMLGERDENTERLDFTPSECVAIGEACEAKERKAAGERKAEGQKSGGRGKKKLSPNFGESKHERESIRRIAKAVGVSGPTFEKAKAVVKAAKAEPKKYADLVTEMDKTGRVSGVHRKLKVRQQSEAIAKEPPPLPEGPFRVIVADPPWSYDKRAGDPSHRGANPYESMTLDDIKAMPIEGMAHDDCILWLWTTNAHMPVAFDVVEAWGFTFKTILTWAKSRMGTGDWLRGKTEHCLLCVRGKPTIRTADSGEAPTTLLHGDAREHSRKPEAFFRLVERICPGSKLELFAREERGGWHSHGSETEKFSGN